MQYSWILFCLLILSIIIIKLVFQLSFIYFIYVIAIVVLSIICWYFLNKMITQEEEKEFIKNQLEIANKSIIKLPNIAIIIVKNNKVVWANDLSYAEFPILKEKRNLNILVEDIKINNDNTFIYQQNSYKYRKNDNVYFIENITNQSNYIRLLENKQTNIAILEIDNFQYLEEHLARENFGNIIRELRIDLIRFFDMNNIYYQEKDGEQYQLIIPENELKELINTKCEKLFDVFKKYQTENYSFSYSLGIATNQPSIRATGYRAREALELARSRGGGQTVIFDDSKRIIFGGGQSVLQGSTLMKARLINVTIMNIIKKKNCIYIMGHKNPDSDVVASIILMYKLIRNKFDIKIKIAIEEYYHEKINNLIKEKINLEIISNPEIIDDNNLLIIVDTQSENYSYSQYLIEKINDIILIDHHQRPDDAIYNPITQWNEPSLSSTVEMLLQMFTVANVKLENKEVATYCLYAMLVDTQNFKYRMNETSFDMIKMLVKYGANMNAAQNMTYDDFEQFKKINALIEKAEIINNFAFLEINDIKENVLLSKLANALLNIKNIMGSIVVSKCEDEYYVKLRSDRINVKLLIEEFGGGGHANQAAATLDIEKYNEFLEKIKKINQE